MSIVYCLRRNILQSSTSEFEQLQQLLLGSELDHLKRLEEQLKRVEFRTKDEREIIQMVMPLLDRMLQERLQNPEDAVVKVLSTHLSALIAQASQTNPAKLSLALQSTIAPAISKEIANNKEKMIDALYPVMGGMVSKYVSEAIREFVESVNEKIEDGLSFNRYKRKVKAKLSGVSESELLLYESRESLISSLLIIHKESGLLIAEAHLQDKALEDSHIVASMATAIKDFINDWIQKSQKQGEVQILSYGDATLYIESAGSVYLIAFLDAVPDQELRSHINSFFGTLLMEYMEIFQGFEGDSSSEEIATLTTKMEAYLNLQEGAEGHTSPAHHSNPMKWIAVLLGIVGLGYGGYLGKVAYFEYQLAQKIEQGTGYQVAVTCSSDRVILEGRIDRFEALSPIEKIVQHATPKPIENQLTMPLAKVQERFAWQERRMDGLSIAVAKRQKRLIEGYEERTKQMAQELEGIQKQLHKLQKYLKATTMSQHDTLSRLNQLNHEREAIERVATMRREIVSALKQAFGQSPLLNSKEGSVDFAKVNLFMPDSDQINDALKPILQESFERYLFVLLNDPTLRSYIQGIVIEGHTDSSGGEQYNLELSQKRAESVRTYLLSQERIKALHAEGLIRAVGLGSRDIVEVNGVEDKEASRRIKIKFEIKSNKIVENIEKIIDD